MYELFSCEMSVLFSNESGWVISHEQFIKKLYENVRKDDQLLQLSYDCMMFDINAKFMRKNQRDSLSENLDSSKGKNRKRGANCVLENIDEVRKVKRLYTKFIKEARSKSLFLDTVICDFNDAAREFSKTFFDPVNQGSLHNTKGCNSCDFAQIVHIGDENYVVPEKSTFYCYDVNDEDKIAGIDRQFDFIVMDPPWWNKSVRRKKKKFSSDSYSMLYNEDLIKIPIDKLLKPGGIIGIWCTNSPSCLKSILDDMFPAWQISFKAKWYWIKVTKTGEAVCDFNETHNKQPYEILVLGSTSENVSIENEKVIISVPSTIHSHKPPLIDIFKPYLPQNPECLEIFARYLLPGWHSLGLEVLKFQHLPLFIKEPIVKTVQIQNNEFKNCYY